MNSNANDCIFNFEKMAVAKDVIQVTKREPLLPGTNAHTTVTFGYFQLLSDSEADLLLNVEIRAV